MTPQNLQQDGEPDRLLADFFDNGVVGLALQAEDGTIRRANRALARMLSLAPQELQGRNAAQFFVDRAAGREVLERLSRGETLNSYRTSLRASDGSTRYVLWSANVLHDRGRFVHARCFVRDVTELEQARRALEDVERLQAAILDASLDAIITMDAQGTLVNCNKAAERIFGYTREQAVGRSLAELIVPAHMRAAHSEGLRRYLATGVGPVLGKRIEISALHANGNEFPVELSITVVSGSPPLFAATLRDISSRKEAETHLGQALAALRASEAALRETNQRKDEFIATLSHELRNPLAPVRNAAELLSMPALTAERRERAVKTILRQTRHMARLLDDLLDVGRVSTGKLRLQKAEVSLLEIVQTGVEEAASVIEARNQRLLLDLPEQDERFEGDPVRLAQVLANLLNNAAKYSPPGSEVRLRAARLADVITIEVADQGRGIDPGSLQDVFAMFTQLAAEDGGVSSGLGIGLPLSRALIEMHGGTITASSEGAGRGATFTIRLPVPQALPRS